MRHFGLALCLFSIGIATGCSRGSLNGDPLDEVASVSAANRPALQACLAAPDLPGNHWPAGAGKARCWLSLEQEPSLKEIAATLSEPDGAVKLDRRYAEILAAHYNDPVHRDALFAAYQDFGTSEGQRLADDWLAKSRGSAFAHMAKGQAALGAAWKARGSRYAADTTDPQFAGMSEQLKIAVPLLESALHDEPRLSPACVDLMDIGDIVGAAALHEAAAQHCSRIDPLSWHVNSMLLTAADPRWGGSFDALDRVVEQIRLREPNSPMLASLLAKGIGRRVYMGWSDDFKLAPIAAGLERTALMAPDPFYLAKAGVAAEHAGNLPKALAYISQALRFAPNEANFLIDRAALRTRMGDRPHALTDALHAAAQPDDCGCRNDADLAMVFFDLHRINEERAELQKVLGNAGQKENHQWALSALCKTYAMEADNEHGLACAKQLADEFPDDSEALYLHALFLYATHDPGAADADARFRKLANASDPGVQGEIAQLNELKNPGAQANQER